MVEVLVFFLLVELTSGEGSAQSSADHIHVFKSYTCVFFSSCSIGIVLWVLLYITAFPKRFQEEIFKMVT